MCRSPFVSIVVPVFNGANFLDVALRSAVYQTYDNFEVVIVDDGSNDQGATERIGRDYAARYPGKVIYHRQNNAGVGGALNTGLRVMRGEIFCWLSHDDIYRPNKIADQVAFYRELGGGEIVLFSDFSQIDACGQVILDAVLPHDDYVDRQFLPLLRAAVNGCTIFVPRSIFDEVGYFDPSLRFVQDYQLWFEILKRYSFFHQPRNLVQYRIHAGQDTNKAEATKEANALWICILSALTEVEMAQTSGSSYRFFRDMATFLGCTPYDRAADRAKQLADTAVDDTLISVVMRPSSDFELDLASVRSVQAQQHQNWELLMALPPNRPVPDELRRAAEADPRIKLFNAGRMQNCAWAAALRRSGGAYIALLEPGAVFDPKKLSRQVRAMQVEGWDWSATSYRIERRLGGASACASRPTGSRRRAVYRSTIMVSRLFLASGEISSFPPATPFSDGPPNGDAGFHQILPDPLVCIFA